MLIFLDFDDVLFNTKKFKDDYFVLFKNKGVNRRMFEKFYYDPSDNRKTKNYVPIEHMQRVCKEINLDYAGFEKEILKFTSDTSQYVFSDANKFLENFSKKDLHLISFSKTNFQESKIYGSGIAKYFSKIDIVNELKGDAIRKTIKNKNRKDNQEIYFIDDRVEHLTDAKNKNPDIKTIFFLRKEGRHKDRRNKYCDYAVTNIEDILKIINLKQKNVQVNK